MKKIRFLLISFMLLISVFMFGCSSNSSISGNNKKIVVGTNAEFEPFEYINEKGEIDGFDPAVMKAIGKSIGYDVEFKNMEFKSLTAALKTGSLDAVIAGMTVTDERKESVDFSYTYYNATQCIIIQKGSSVSSIEDLNGKEIAVQEGTTGDILVTPSENNERITNANTNVKRFKKGSDAVLELKNGGVDAVVIDKSPAKKYVSLNSDSLELIEDEESTESYAIAVAKGNKELLDDINKGLEEIKENGEFDKLVDEYINKEQSTNESDSQNFFVKTAHKIKYVFVDTNGYKLLLKGLGLTIAITVFAIIIGTILGFIIAFMKMTEVKNKRKTVLSRLAGAYISVLRGTPVVVQLLIMYMVIFKSHYGFIAAVLTFGLNSSAYVAENIRAGIMAVDNGQMEGGLSLGFTYGQTMRYIVLPQSVKNCLPALGNEFVALLKETSIVGYIAIQDLTKAADFIISRTYETFLPLIAIAIVYFVIVMILTKIVKETERRLRQGDMR